VTSEPTAALLLPKLPMVKSGTAQLPTLLSAILQGFYEYRRSGSNRHAPFGAPDFESERNTALWSLWILRVPD
jgi:hypothetical protein